MCQCLLPITSIGGGGESRAQPSAPTVMFLPPKFHPPPSHAPPTPTPRSVSLLLSSIPLSCSVPSEKLQWAPWEGVSHFCRLCPPASCPLPLPLCSGSGLRRRTFSRHLLMSVGPKDFSVHYRQSPYSPPIPSSQGYFSFGGLLPYLQGLVAPALVDLLCPHILIFMGSWYLFLNPHFCDFFPLCLAHLPVSVICILVPISVVFLLSPCTIPHIRGVLSVPMDLSPSSWGCSLCPPAALVSEVLCCLWSAPMFPWAFLSFLWAFPCSCPCGVYGPWLTSVSFDGLAIPFHFSLSL